MCLPSSALRAHRGLQLQPLAAAGVDAARHSLQRYAHLLVLLVRSRHGAVCLPSSAFKRAGLITLLVRPRRRAVCLPSSAPRVHQGLQLWPLAAAGTLAARHSRPAAERQLPICSGPKGIIC